MTFLCPVSFGTNIRGKGCLVQEKRAAVLTLPSRGLHWLQCSHILYKNKAGNFVKVRDILKLVFFVFSSLHMGGEGLLNVGTVVFP